MSPRANLDISPAYCLKLRHKDSSCRLCLESCPTSAISIDQSLTVDSSLCNGCGICVNVCPTGVFQLPDTPYRRLLDKRYPAWDTSMKPLWSLPSGVALRQ
jgi:ferredoxin